MIFRPISDEIIVIKGLDNEGTSTTCKNNVVDDARVIVSFPIIVFPCFLAFSFSQVRSKHVCISEKKQEKDGLVRGTLRKEG